jgi:hypothetical protein
VDYRRRVIVAAGIECDVHGIGGAATDVPVKEFVQIFMTQPASTEGGGNRFSIWGEVVGTAESTKTNGNGPTGLYRDMVQLYR